MTMDIAENLHFSKEIPEPIRAACLKAWEKFKPLHRHEVWIRPRNMKTVTMRAQPWLNRNFFFSARRGYHIDYQPFPSFGNIQSMQEVPEEVLVGWFAHEFGHLIDYLSRGWVNLIGFGMAYLWMPVFRTGVERRADLFAIEYGYGDAIQRTKAFILKESNIPDVYLNRINRFYMSPEEVSQVVLDQDEKTSRDSIL